LHVAWGFGYGRSSGVTTIFFTGPEVSLRN